MVSARICGLFAEQITTVVFNRSLLYQLELREELLL
jgi:hypothetical protein